MCTLFNTHLKHRNKEFVLRIFCNQIIWNTQIVAALKVTTIYHNWMHDLKIEKLIRCGFIIVTDTRDKMTRVYAEWKLGLHLSELNNWGVTIEMRVSPCNEINRDKVRISCIWQLTGLKSWSCMCVVDERRVKDKWNQSNLSPLRENLHLATKTIVTQFLSRWDLFGLLTECYHSRFQHSHKADRSS